MLTIDTILKPAGAKGIGLFTAEKLDAGDVWWRYDGRFDRTVRLHDAMPVAVEAFLRKYACRQPDGLWQICLDNARFLNHSERPNTGAVMDGQGRIVELLALRNIAAGEELTCDYREHCQACRRDLGFTNLERPRRRRT